MGLRKECVLVDLPEETLMAYADGALNESERRHVEAILAYTTLFRSLLAQRALSGRASHAASFAAVEAGASPLSMR